MKIGNRIYPDSPHERMMKVKVEDSSKGRYQFDENYPYYEDGLWYRINKLLCSIVLNCLAIPYMKIAMGLRVKGREVLKKYSKELEGGAVTICNHVYLMDAVAVSWAVRKFRQIHILMYAKHFNNPGFHWMLHSMGGVPIAENIAGMRKFDEAFDKFHEQKQWIHVFPEEVRWDYYPYLRPFRKGAFSMAYKYQIPVLPLVITFRERKGLYKLFGKADTPLMTVNILEPVLPQKGARRKEEVVRMRKEAHAKMVERMGVDNIWPAIPEDEVV